MSLYTIKTYLAFSASRQGLLTLEIDEMKAKEMAVSFFGHYHNMDDNVNAVLKEKSWYVILNVENSKQVEVLIDTNSCKILRYVSLDTNLHNLSN